jgi:predicted nuclease of predicted toxin-antitoxin system
LTPATPTLWLDAQLPPQLSVWLRNELKMDAYALREIGLHNAGDRKISMRREQIASSC